MPNIVAEYSQGLEEVFAPNELLTCLYGAVMESGLFAQQAIKVRLLPYEHYSVGAEKLPFIHITVSMMSGRSTGQKRSLTTKVLDRVREIAGEQLSITVDARDVDTQVYAKHSG